MKRILTTLSQKWPEYLLEILVLIIGIYGAFALEEWNDTRKSSDRQKLFLEHIQSNLEQDRMQLHELLEICEDIRDRSLILIEGFKANTIDVEFATGSAGILALEKNFNGRRAGMDALINSGKIDLLPSQLNLDLQQYYELSEDLVNREKMSNSFINDFYEPRFFEKYAESFSQLDGYNIKELYQGDTRPVKLIDREEYLLDRISESHIIIRHVHSKLEATMYQDLINLNDSLKNSIQQYLAQP